MDMFKHKNICVLFCLLLPSIAPADPETSLTSVYYMVEGNTAEEIWKDVMAKTPVVKHDKIHVAYTKWHVNWQVWWFDKGGSCEISKISTKLDVTYTLPKLKQAAAMEDSAKSRWEAYYFALFEHEQGHKNLGVQAAVEIENRIANMGARTNCKELELAANEIGKSVIAKYSRIEKEYDRSTNHGLNTGAVFTY